MLDILFIIFCLLISPIVLFVVMVTVALSIIIAAAFTGMVID